MGGIVSGFFAAVMASGGGVPSTPTLYHVIVTGQSNAIGAEGFPIFDTSTGN